MRHIMPVPRDDRMKESHDRACDAAV